MNILHMKYAVEVARCGSINRAAEILMITQPNVSRAIKELESELGIQIFLRTSKGMILTPDGEGFVCYAQAILKQIDEVEMLYKNGPQQKQKFSIAVPRASYIADAFVKFTQCIGAEEAEFFYKETNSRKAIDGVLSNDYSMGIVRYAEQYDQFFKSLFEEKALCSEMITEFSYVLLMHKDSPLAKKDSIVFDDLKEYIEIAHADPYAPSLPLAKVIKEEIPDNIKRRIYIFERGSQFELLAENPKTFMWVSSVPQKMLDRFGLVQRVCSENYKLYKDVLIYKDGYKLTEEDRQFITCLCDSMRECLG